jgi:hypothetical protein
MPVKYLFLISIYYFIPSLCKDYFITKNTLSIFQDFPNGYFIYNFRNVRRYFAELRHIRALSYIRPNTGYISPERLWSVKAAADAEGFAEHDVSVAFFTRRPSFRIIRTRSAYAPSTLRAARLSRIYTDAIRVHIPA